MPCPNITPQRSCWFSTNDEKKCCGCYGRSRHTSASTNMKKPALHKSCANVGNHVVHTTKVRHPQHFRSVGTIVQISNCSATPGHGRAHMVSLVFSGIPIFFDIKTESGGRVTNSSLFCIKYHACQAVSSRWCCLLEQGTAAAAPGI
jgi:hypothetical protein